MSLTEALSAALAALAAPNNGEQANVPSSQLEVAVLDRSRPHRTFRRVVGSRLEELLQESRPAQSADSAPDTTDDEPVGPSAPADGTSAPGTSTGPT